MSLRVSVWWETPLRDGGTLSSDEIRSCLTLKSENICPFILGSAKILWDRKRRWSRIQGGGHPDSGCQLAYGSLIINQSLDYFPTPSLRLHDWLSTCPATRVVPRGGNSRVNISVSVCFCWLAGVLSAITIRYTHHLNYGFSVGTWLPPCLRSEIFAVVIVMDFIFCIGLLELIEQMKTIVNLNVEW